MIKITQKAKKFISQEIKKDGGDCVVLKKSTAGRIFYFYENRNKLFDRGMVVEYDEFTLFYDFFDNALVDVKDGNLIITIT